MANYVSAVFDNRADAEGLINWLRNNGVSEDAFTVVSGHDNTGTTGVNNTASEAANDAADAGKGALTGTAIGAGVGALFGLAAVAIPGVGPFITAGWLASALGTTAGAAAAGAVVGGVSGGLASALSHWGLNEAESNYYAGEVERGGTFVSVDTDRTNVNPQMIRDAFQQYGGRYAAA